MKNKVFILIASMLLSVACYAQNTTVTATVVDGDSVTWANATWTIDFVPGIQFPNPAQYSINGSALSGTVTHETGSLNSSGALSVVVYDSSIVTPTGSGWRLNICPLTSGSCVIYQFSTSGSSQSISTNLTTLIGQPRFSCTQVCRGYNTIEATGMSAGSIFYNTSPTASPVCNQYNGSSWAACTGTYETHSGNCANAPTAGAVFGPGSLGGAPSSGSCTGAYSGASGQSLALATGNLKNLSCSSSAVGASASDGVAVVYLGSAGTYNATALTCTIGTSSSCTDTTHLVSATAGQVVSVHITAANPTTLSNVTCTVGYQ